MPVTDRKRRFNTRFIGVMNQKWSVAVERCGLDAVGLCDELGITRRQAVRMVKREPTRIEWLAMLAIFHKLDQPL